jgi:hypothetical protein
MKFQKHSETSFAAAVSILETADTLRAKVYRYLRDSKGGATDESIQLALEMNPSTQRPRRVELLEGKFIRDSGRTSNTISGRSAVVWEVVPLPTGQGEEKPDKLATFF